MRFLLSTLVYFWTATFSNAAITPEEVQNLIYQGDFHRIEAALKQAHADTLSGDLPYDDLRDLTIVLGRTHPDTVDLREDWLRAYPTSPYARMAKAWALYNESFDVRGGLSARKTPRNALIAFNQMQNEAMDISMSTYADFPDYVPASDGVLRMQLTTKRLWKWVFLGVVGDVMETTPNYGSLLRASFNSSQNWGGYGESFNSYLCNTYADALPGHPDLDSDVCLVSLLDANDYHDGNWDFISEVLDRSDHTLLEDARIERAILRRTRDDRALIEDVLDEYRFTTPWLTGKLRVAREYRRLFASMDQDDTDLKARVVQRLFEGVSAQLEHDPFRLKLLEIEVWGDQYLGASKHPMDAQDRNQLMRIAVMQPYHINNWYKAALHNPRSRDPSYLNSEDVASVNTVALSTDNLAAITNFLTFKLSQLHRFEMRAATISINGNPWPEPDVFYQQVGCRIARLIRLFDDVASRHPEQRLEIEGYRINKQLDRVEAELRETGYCTHIWEADIADLQFAYIEIDRRSLMTYEEGKFPYE